MSSGLRDVLELSALSEADHYKLLSVAVQPRPIAWVSTVSADGVANLAPYSFFTVASRKPPTVLVSIGERGGVPGEVKDTLANVRATGEMVVNIADVGAADAVAHSSTELEPAIDEFEYAGIDRVPSRFVAPPTVRDALIALECRLAGEVAVGTDVLVLGEVVGMTCRAELVDERLHIGDGVHSFLGRLAGPYFTTPATRIAQISGIGVAAARPEAER